MGTTDCRQLVALVVMDQEALVVLGPRGTGKRHPHRIAGTEPGQGKTVQLRHAGCNMDRHCTGSIEVRLDLALGLGLGLGLGLVQRRSPS